MLIMREMKLQVNSRLFPRMLPKSKFPLRKTNLIMETKRNRKKKKRGLPSAHRSQSETRERRTRNVEESVVFQFNPYSY
jgi:hypothetical protein